MGNAASWSNGKKTIQGAWRYNWAQDSFTVTIQMPRADSITGDKSKTFSIHGDSPEWEKWKLIREPISKPAASDGRAITPR